MILNMVRYSETKEDTAGLLLESDQFLCHTWEDEARAVKKFGETRIPAGTYQLDLRTAGRLHGIYSERYSFHRGMIWIRNVPNFTFIYFHTGNNDNHSDGCPLVGDMPRSNIIEPGGDNLMQSRQAYTRIYPGIAAAIQTVGCMLTIHDTIGGI